MTNGEKFKTIKERTIAFRKFCTNKICKGRDANYIFSDKIHDKFHHKCEFAWLDLEYKEELLPCPFCGGEAERSHQWVKETSYPVIRCKLCDTITKLCATGEEAIAVWNRRV